MWSLHCSPPWNNRVKKVINTHERCLLYTDDKRADGENLADIPDLLGPRHGTQSSASVVLRRGAAAYRDISAGCEALLKEAL